ncbi:hypothetical protein [Paenibacillus sp. P22]|uniref:hypothetical protein n=1 Tax=Paenibacillus sp. P22 TaxID=483908 RepID=UPI000661623B|nr:hypothetical protein [Paenibacillus sp. P22]
MERWRQAVRNNAVWCGIVCDAHGIEHGCTGDVWLTSTPAPAFYPDMITLASHIDPSAAQLHAEDRKRTFIKDSFASLDLFSCGYEILFDASWIFHPAASKSAPIAAGWRVVSSAADFELWVEAAGLASVLHPEAMERQEVKLFMHDEDGTSAGFIATCAADVVGISNVWETGRSAWPDFAPIVSRAYPGVDLVGYERDGNLRAARQSGWQELGPLRVWKRKT